MLMPWKCRELGADMVEAARPWFRSVAAGAGLVFFLLSFLLLCTPSYDRGFSLIFQANLSQEKVPASPAEQKEPNPWSQVAMRLKRVPESRLLQVPDDSEADYGSLSAERWEQQERSGRAQPRLRTGGSPLTLAASDRGGRAPEAAAQGKVAFMFLIRCDIPLQRAWDRFFEGHQDRASIIIHVSNSSCRHWRPSLHGSFSKGAIMVYEPAAWGDISLAHSEKTLMRLGLKDPSNQFFVLVSESCLPVRNFDFIHNYLFSANRSFVHSGIAEDYSGNITLEFAREEYKSGSQWIALARRHAEMVVADETFIKKFKYCRTAEEHYFASFFTMNDTEGVEPRTLLYYRWPTHCLSNHHLLLPTNEMPPEPEAIRSLGQHKLLGNCSHPITFFPSTLTAEALHHIQTLTHFEQKPCMAGSLPASCFLFARKFDHRSVDDYLALGLLLGF